MAVDDSDEGESPLQRLRRILTPEEFEHLFEGSAQPPSAAERAYEAALAQERELLAQGRKHALWQPPSEDEFNHEWFTPLDALEVSDERLADDADKWEIVEKLRAGQIIAVARTGQLRGDLEGVQPFVHVSSGCWERMGQSAELYFWKRGSLVVEHRDWGKQRFFDIRFDPQSFSGAPPRVVPLEEPILRPKQGLPVPADPAPLRGREISNDEASRFSRAILAGWPDATEKFAHAKALAFFPDNKVPREWFLRIFRSIRGHKNRGVQPKTRD